MIKKIAIFVGITLAATSLSLAQEIGHDPKAPHKPGSIGEVISKPPRINVDELVFVGGWASGGGDQLRNRVVEGKELAVKMLEKVDFSWVSGEETAIKETKLINREYINLRSWLIENQKNLIREIRSSPIKWIEAAFEDTSVCSRTQFYNNAPIEFSLKNCRLSGSLKSAEDSAKLLLHEAAHHLKITDHNIADEIANLTFFLWDRYTAGHLEVCNPRKRNKMVSRLLPGRIWERDGNISKLLGTIDTKEELGRQLSWVKFTEDNSVLKTIVRGGGSEACVHLAGFVEYPYNEYVGRDSADKPIYEPAIKKLRFHVADYNGALQVYTYRGQGVGDSAYISVAGGGEGAQNDALLIGGDHLYEGTLIFTSPLSDRARKVSDF